jgi:hypothetical protein
MNITDQRSFNLNRDQREEYIAGYSLMIRKNRFGRVPHYINFMFNHVPGNRKTKMEFMKKQVIRVHDILTRSIVRKPNSEDWKPSRPILVGCPDLPVWKKEKKDKEPIRNLIVNDGLHFNAICLTPPDKTFVREEGDCNWYAKSRLKMSLERHFEQCQRFYQTEHLYRIHVTPITHRIDAVTEYTLKAFKNGYITADDILVMK